MKIIKEFEDHDFFERHYYISYDNEELKKSYWRWGLGDDGELYYQSYASNLPGKWYNYPDARCYTENLLVNFDEMKRIVKEFGHLVVFI